MNPTKPRLELVRRVRSPLDLLLQVVRTYGFAGASEADVARAAREFLRHFDAKQDASDASRD